MRSMLLLPIFLFSFAQSRYMNSESFHLVKKLHEAFNPHSNFVICPYSIALSLGMLYLATNRTSESAGQIVELGWNISRKKPGKINRYLHGLMNLLTDIAQFDEDWNPILDAFAIMVVDKRYEVSENYYILLEDIFGGKLRPIINIDLGENGGQIVQLINEDVSNKTRGKITDLLPYHLLKSSTPMALVNAVYFKAEWDKGFGPDKHHKTFRTTVYGPIKAVKMMSSTIHVPYFENDEFQIVSLPLYSEGLKFNVYFLLPRIENGTESLVKACAKLGAEGALMSIPTKLPDKFVKVTIPNFHINHNDDLINELQSIGIQDMFEKGSSDFSSLLLNHNSDMYIHKFQHKASIWVHESGLEAAASSGVGLIDTIGASPEKFFVADHPFLFYITVRSGNYEHFLFSGQFTEPV